jgi:hypothetical protein
MPQGFGCWSQPLPQSTMTKHLQNYTNPQVNTPCHLVEIQVNDLSKQLWGENVEDYGQEKDGPSLVTPKVDGVAYVYLVSPVIVSPQNCAFWLLSESSRPLSVGDTVWQLENSLGLDLVMREGIVMIEEVKRMESSVFNTSGMLLALPLKAVPKHAAQESALLQLIGQIGHEPKSLPRNAKGKPGVKADVKREALKHTAIFTVSTFEHAWERLSKNGDILYLD